MPQPWAPPTSGRGAAAAGRRCRARRGLPARWYPLEGGRTRGCARAAPAARRRRACAGGRERPSSSAHRPGRGLRPAEHAALWPIRADPRKLALYLSHMGELRLEAEAADLGPSCRRAVAAGPQRQRRDAPLGCATVPLLNRTGARSACSVCSCASSSGPTACYSTPRRRPRRQQAAPGGQLANGKPALLLTSFQLNEMKAAADFSGNLPLADAKAGGDLGTLQAFAKLQEDSGAMR